MKRLRFTILIGMMLLSVVGIIWVQIIWIRDAIRIQTDSFNNSVAISLSEARNAIEFSRKMNFLNNFLMDDPVAFRNDSENMEFMIESYSSSNGNGIHYNITNQSVSGNSDTAHITTRNQYGYINSDTSIVRDTVSYITTTPDRNGRFRVIQESGIDNPGSPYMRQNEFVDWLRKRSNEFRNLSDQMISEIYQWEKTLELDPAEISNALKRSLAFTNIETPYEFAVIRNGEVQEGTYTKASKKDFLNSKYKVWLFPDNIVDQDILLSVVFPEKTNYVLGSMGWILGGSMVFSLFILATFALSLYFIITTKKVSEMKSDFLNNMTHEFKTPIATISLAADTITNPKVIGDESSIRHFVGMIKKENSRMNKKVETILQIASLDKKEIDFRFENVSLHTIIGHAVETIEIQVHQRGGKIILHLDATEPIIYGDSEHLTNLVNNFLDNALKYSPETPEITVSTKNIGRGVMMIIEDKGIGMSKAVQSKIFERFYRQTSGNVHNVKGFGLGLNYARAIIDAHKGNVTVFSEPDKGSRFEIFLPFNSENQP
ncbi:MAG TPA: HAMP domain-containing sensor histidine kinase [Bacteroidales bacterium]|nr:HAMP domain-containing sensor histidine kinase [Bacteroidales bacterium]